VPELVAQFNATNYFELVSNKLYTRQGMNRAPLPWGAEHDPCRDAIFAEFQRVGLQPYKDLFSYVDTTNNTLINVGNVIAVLEGVQNPNNEIYVIGSHYDSKNNPGADDNATGVACQLEMAASLPHIISAKTLVFAIFDRRGTLGSRHRPASVWAACAMWTSTVRTHQGHGVGGHDRLAGLGFIIQQGVHAAGARVSTPSAPSFANAMLAYGSGLTPVITNLDNVGDHYSFEQAGISGVHVARSLLHRKSELSQGHGLRGNPRLPRLELRAQNGQSAIGFFAEKNPTRGRHAPRGGDSANHQRRDCHSIYRSAALPIRRRTLHQPAAPVWVAVETIRLGQRWQLHPTDARPRAAPAASIARRFVAGYIGTPVLAPALIATTVSRTVDVGQPVSFVVSATGTGAAALPVVVQWQPIPARPTTHA